MLRLRESKEKIENALEESKNIFKVITSSTPDHILVQDLDLKYSVVVNPQLGLKAEDMLGKTDYELMSRHNAENVTRIKRKVLDTGSTIKVELPLTTSDGETQFFEGAYVPKYDIRGQIDGLIGYFRNVTKRKVAETTLKNTLKDKETLLREVHHRVKNNMQIIYSMMRMQSRRTNNKYVKSALEDGQGRIKSMALINELLYKSDNISELDANKYLNDLLIYLSDAYKDSTKKIEINADIDLILLDLDIALSVGLILNELVSNSLKYAFQKKNEGKINISFKSKNDNYNLIVKDDGIGLPEDFDLQKIESLGLQLVSSLTKQLGGTFEIKSDNGTEFHIYFPANNK